MRHIAAIAVMSLAATAAAQPPTVDAGSSNRDEVRRLVEHSQLVDVATRAVAYGNDVEIWVNRDFSVVLDAASCDQQRDFAASVWLRWAKMVDQAGADVTIKSYTGRVLASAGRGLLGPRFHCE